jgi:hypothetical protein
MSIDFSGKTQIKAHHETEEGYVTVTFTDSESNDLGSITIEERSYQALTRALSLVAEERARRQTAIQAKYRVVFGIQDDSAEITLT